MKNASNWPGVRLPSMTSLWGGLDAVRTAFGRQGEVQSLRLRLEGIDALDKLRAALGTISGAPLNVVTEADLYAAQSAGTANLIRLFGWPLSLLMALGATAGALNTMMSSVSDRTIEIATARALGFSRLSAFIATWVEAVVLAALGVTIGLAVSWLVFNGWQAGTIGINNASMSFQLTMDGLVMLIAGLLGLAIGIVGGASPALYSMRLPCAMVGNYPVASRYLRSLSATANGARTHSHAKPSRLESVIKNRPALLPFDECYEAYKVHGYHQRDDIAATIGSQSDTPFP